MKISERLRRACYFVSTLGGHPQRGHAQSHEIARPRHTDASGPMNRHHRVSVRRFSRRSLTCGVLALSAVLGNAACSGENDGGAEHEVGPICAGCGPSTGGETGDFSGSLVDCRPYIQEAALEEAESTLLSVSDFESRLAQPIDEPLLWRIDDDPVPGRQPFEVSGYERNTRVLATVTLTSPYRFFKRDSCVDESCEQCGSWLEVDVSIALRTADGAVQATTDGIAFSSLRDEGKESPWIMTAFNTDVDLRDVIGTLRFHPEPVASLHGRLSFSSRLDDSFYGGQIMFFVDGGSEANPGLPAIEGDAYIPLIGSFPK